MVKTTVIGNYPKIPGFGEAKLRKSLHEFDKGAISREQLEMVIREVTLESIIEQEIAGIDIITDGQIRWQDEVTYIMGALSGAELNGLVRFFDTNTYYRMPLIKNKVGYKGKILTSDYILAKENSKKEVKAVLTGAYTLAKLSENKFYKSVEDGLCFDIAGALNQEIRALADAGAKHIQINEPYLAYSQNWADKELVLQLFAKVFEGINARKWLVTYLGDLESIEVFAQAADVVGIDFVEGKRNLELLRNANIPAGKGLCLGIVNARNTNTEKFEDVSSIIQMGIEKVGSDNIYLSPNTGLDYLPREKALDKMKTLVGICRQSQQLVSQSQ
ncbi:TPA: hypothetical protein HA316_01845 [Candidatus Micrarchaeota archaeon]|nr:hypothetical protein [Candidatus Micrarchaeota archaeon]